ncbi:enoyl-CoA hydratase/isomerase family protein [Bordetella bronchiseptica GA96-01]|uniref:enoyl-CoA hydratase/isomerase family protein n=1 Tax=Bordetella bronchiseptica TaxID=518 RepID=UPI00045B3C24|nr:enoyl-CoA hydratase/isomerase family protein [Bordetella bronchiseptica]AZW29205.1 enoyl-CoA hydratase/isomerase family protein [Bordetella bronchiseptica]KCV45497.1 enoyl-CoA hydratase/isomerase family protein [Bordetella bronchiseptica 345]KDC38503.1 enoyl-CoA hydratase/isomerase family protein [Bordetella bronchiseptica GA96-01]KDD50235.1 enoyl-CoA hydratase/isomerase family protein [Bordetella bronchiseptica OSU553]
MDDTLLIDDPAPGVRVITLNRPQRLNALDGPTLARLNAAVRDSTAPERGLRVLVIRGAGRAFCSGVDLKWAASGVLDDRAAHQRNQDLMQETYEALEAAPQIVIASVNGFAVAGGLELALACDIIVASDEAQLGDEHIRKNLFPSGGSTQRLPRKIGLARAMYYLVTGRRMSGREAERIGLASLAVPPLELDAVSLGLAEEIARADALALASMKLMARRSLELPLKDGLAMERWMQFRYRTASPSLDAGVRKFAEG